eukprot:INCI11722.2.p1 GENE.INCI11722.2~~INCI11722.2.p1  ORF type:complete len:101 (-),score=13.49 INCI11722.2:432-734(-)
MGLKDRRRRRVLEASRYGDEESMSTESTLTAEQTFSHVREHEGAVAFKGEQLLVLLTVRAFCFASCTLSLSSAAPLFADFLGCVGCPGGTDSVRDLSWNT